MIQRGVVSFLLTNERGEVLLQQRDDKPGIPYPNMWTLFGGTIEQGETPDEAVLREMVEELGFEQSVTQWYVYECPVRSKRGEVITTHYSYTAPISRPLESLTLLEGQDMRFFGRDQLPGMVLAFDQETVLARFFAENRP